MPTSRYRLQLLFLALCAAQLFVTGAGLIVAYQVLHSYYVDTVYEKSVNEDRRDLAELEVYVRSAAPQNLALDDDSSAPNQISQIEYACGLFDRKAKGVLARVEARESTAPFVVLSASDLQALISEMNELAAQSRLAASAWERGDAAQMRAYLTYADRASARAQLISGKIDQEMTAAKDHVLASRSAKAHSTQLLLLPISIVGTLLLVPAFLYARQLNKDIQEYEAQVEEEKNRLEERVATRTHQLQTEIDLRKRLEAFNSNRNDLLEQVAQGQDIYAVLAQLTIATEQSVPNSHCVALLPYAHGSSLSPVSSSVPADVATYLEATLSRSWDAVSTQDAQGRAIALVSESEPDTRVTFRDVWSQGYQRILAVSVAGQPLQGFVVLLLRENQERDDFAWEVLFSGARMASVALENHRMQDELFRRAHQDALTGLPNRALFEDRLEQALARASRRNTRVGVLCIDLDGFKEINDRYGHEAGDWLLRQVALRITSCIRKADTVARIGGDEFVAAIEDVQHCADLAKVADSVLDLLRAPYTFEGVTFLVTASIGASLFPSDGSSSEELRRHADLAMYRAKESGRNALQMFSADLGEKLARRRQIEQYVQEALQNEGFEIEYQPIFTVKRALVGLEALVRFRSPELKRISPADFIPVAEQTGQISAVGEWVMREACRHVRLWQRHGLPAVPVAVNVSAVQLGRRDFAENVRQILTETSLAPALLHIEVTETAVMNNIDESRSQLCALAEMGIHISVDDFGTGHSSLSYLHCLPLKALKIDRSFVNQIAVSHHSKAIVRAIIAMAQSLNLEVVAEGVETEDQLRVLEVSGCGLAQGYLLAKPLDPQSARELLRLGSLPSVARALPEP